jgi:hypothetical protein
LSPKSHANSDLPRSFRNDEDVHARISAELFDPESSLEETSKNTWLWLDTFASEHDAAHGNQACELCDIVDRVMRLLPEKPNLKDIAQFVKKYGFDPSSNVPSKKAR